MKTKPTLCPNGRHFVLQQYKSGANLSIFSASLTINIIERKRSWNRVVAYPICLSVCLERKVYCDKTVNWIWMPFGMVTGGGVSRGMIVLHGVVWWWSKGKGSFGDEFGASHCNQWGLCCVVVWKRCTVPNYFAQDLFTLYKQHYCACLKWCFINFATALLYFRYYFAAGCRSWLF